MKRVLWLLLCLLGGSAAAFAADLPAAPFPQSLPVAAYNWGGLYYGINGGYGFGNSDWQAAPGFPDTGHFNVDGGLVGGTVGVNVQYGQFVFGVEADVDGTTVNGSVACGLGTCETSNGWLVTVRGRVGYAIDRVLLFGTAGGAAGNVKATVAGIGTGGNTEAGWAAGAGVEYGLMDMMTARIEYLFVDLANGECSIGVCGMPIPVNFDASLVRVGVNIKLPF